MIVSFLSGTSRAFPNRIGQAFVKQAAVAKWRIAFVDASFD
jgi:hypothetical protein